MVPGEVLPLVELCAGEVLSDGLDPDELDPCVASHWSSIVASPELTALKQNSSPGDPSLE